MNAVISPVVYATPAVTNPITIYANSAPAGPAVAIACPEPKKRPVPYSTRLEAVEIEYCHDFIRGTCINIQSFLQWQSY